VQATPVVAVTNNCGSTNLSTGATGSFSWSNGATTSSINVTTAGNYSVTVTNADGCSATSLLAAVTVRALPSAPVVIVDNNCGSSTLTASNTTGSILWSNGAITASITVTDNATYTVTQTVNGCISLSGAGTSVPKTVQATPVVVVSNNCGSTTLSTIATGSLSWSNGGTSSSIDVTSAGNYSVTAVNTDGCQATSAVTAVTVKAVPSAPTVNVVNNCGSSKLTASNTTGSILWSNGATTASITVTDNATYTVTQTVSGCESVFGSGTSAPKAAQATPVIVVSNNCGLTTLSTNATGSLVWSNGGATTHLSM
jgi:hypothetical protein